MWGKWGMFWSVRAGANFFSVKAPCRGADIAPPSGRVTPEIPAALTAERSVAAPADQHPGEKTLSLPPLPADLFPSFPTFPDRAGSGGAFRGMWGMRGMAGSIPAG